jgi:putative acetyltransferase
MAMKASHPLRPFMLSDTMALRDLYAQSIEELTAEDYTPEQRLAWIAVAEDGEAFARRLEKATTLVVQIEGEYAGFACLKDGTLDMLYVHPYFIRDGVGSTLADAMERLAGARGAKELTVEASDTAKEFFAGRGYVATRRNSIPLEDQWLSNTTMTKQLSPPEDVRTPKR